MTQPPTNTWTRREQQLRTAERAIAMLERKNDELEARAERAEMKLEALENHMKASTP